METMASQEPRANLNIILIFVYLTEMKKKLEYVIRKYLLLICKSQQPELTLSDTGQTPRGARFYGGPKKH